MMETMAKRDPKAMVDLFLGGVGKFPGANDPVDSSEFMTVDQVVEALDNRLTQQAVRKQLRLGQLVGKKIGRRWFVSRSNFEKFEFGDT